MEPIPWQLMRSYLSSAQLQLTIAQHTKVGADWNYHIRQPDVNRLYYILEGAGNVQQGTALPKTMRDYLNDEGIKNLKHPSKQTWTVQQAQQTIAWLRGVG